MTKKRLTPEPTEKLFISAESLLRDSMELGLRVVRSGFRPSFLVGVWRGGAPIGIAVQEILEYNGIDCDHISIRTSAYLGIDQQARTVRVHAIDYLVSVLNAEDSLLLIDDVFDSGAICPITSGSRRCISSPRAIAARSCRITTCGPRIDGWCSPTRWTD
jgi:hypothetical protein